MKALYTKLLAATILTLPVTFGAFTIPTAENDREITPGGNVQHSGTAPKTAAELIAELKQSFKRNNPNAGIRENKPHRETFLSDAFWAAKELLNLGETDKAIAAFQKVIKGTSPRARDEAIRLLLALSAELANRTAPL